MATAHILYKGNLRTEMTHLNSGSIIQTDAPLDNHGQGKLFSPTDLTSSSLAACMITLMGITANAHNFELGEVEADIYKFMASNPRRIERIKIDFKFLDAKYDEKQKAFLKSAALNCPVAKSLHPDIVQEISFNFQ